MDQMNVSITNHLAGYVRKKVKSGDILADLTAHQVEGIRNRVRASIESIERGEYTEYSGHAGLERLADAVKATGRKRLAADIPRQ